MRTPSTSKLKKVLSAIAGSYVCWAFIALVLFDCGARLSFGVWPIDHFNSPNRSWVYWATKDFRANCPPHPDIVLLGSSLMMAALHGGDATYLNLPQNVAFHHRSAYLEHLMSDKVGAPVSTFAFAIGGQMVSDAYAITQTLLHGDARPKTIVYGIAPRDFMDNTLTSPASTETFRYMSRIGDLSVVNLPARSAFWERTEWAAGQASFLYNRRLDFVYLQQKYARALLGSLLGMKDLDLVHAPFPLRKIAMFELPEDNGPNELMILPYKAGDQKYTDNSDEYRKRYRSFRMSLFNMQLSFLQRMLAYCRDEGIDLVLVNMPLTTDNVALMPPGFYDHYLNTVRSLSSNYGAHVLDLNDPQIFTKQMFADSVHLNGFGGKRLFEVLSERLAGESRLAVSKRVTLK